MRVEIDSTTHVGGIDRESFAEQLKEVVDQQIRSAGLDPDEVEIEEFYYEEERGDNLDLGPRVELEVRPA